MKRILHILFAATMLLTNGGIFAAETDTTKLDTLKDSFAITDETRERLMEQRIAAQVTKGIQDQLDVLQRQAEKTKGSQSAVSDQVKAELWALALLSIVVVIALLLVTFFIRKTNYTATDMINASALIMLVYGTVFLTIKAGDTHQLTGPIGVLGAIAGYLFGHATKKDG